MVRTTLSVVRWSVFMCDPGSLLCFSRRNIQSSFEVRRYEIPRRTFGGEVQLLYGRDNTLSKCDFATTVTRGATLVPCSGPVVYFQEKIEASGIRL